MPSKTIAYLNHDAVTLKCAHGEHFSEWFLTCDLSQSIGIEDIAQKYEILVNLIVQNHITPVYEKTFGYLSELPDFLNCRSSVYRKFEISPETIPLSYIQGESAARNARFAGLHVYGIEVRERSKVRITSINSKEGCYGKMIESQGIKQAFFMNLPRGRQNPAPGVRRTDIENAFTDLEKSLLSAGFDHADLIRTWFYLGQILPDYDTFNFVRKHRYAGKIDERRLPASTGIQGLSAINSIISLDAMALRTGDSWPKVQTMTSPVQPEARTYGPLFSRGVEIVWPQYKILYVSGTASIDERGRSAHIDDPESQIKNTLNNISLLLKKCGADMDDIVHGCAFLKRRSLEPVFEKVLRQNNWLNMPCLRLCADICRDDLFFEMDCIALVQ